MKKNVKTYAIASILLVATFFSYKLLHKPKELIVIEGNALLPQYTKEEMVRQSDAVVIAEVKNIAFIKQSSESRTDSEEVVTSVSLNVQKYLRNYSNTSSNEILVKTLGGTVDNVTMKMDGAATFKVGERVLVFLKEKYDGTFTVYGWIQGKYSIADDGRLAIGETEINNLNSLFGYRLTIEEIQEEVALYEALAPIKENLSNPTVFNSLPIDNNAEVNKILNSSR